jgi:iron complex outermembrane recepter protein
MFSYSKFVIAILLCSGLQMSAQFTISGTVKDMLGNPIKESAVEISQLNIGVLTNELGYFELQNVPNGKHLVLTRHLGLKDFEKPFEIKNADIEINLVFPAESAVVEGFVLPSPSIVSIPPIQILQLAMKVTPVATTDITADQLKPLNNGQDLPYLLRFTPSLVVTSDAGTGVGYTGVRIRGSDQSRINVTINGVPLNDAESQNVYWVDIPDIASSVDNIQIQRGVGTSTNGSGAFGGSIKLNTLNHKPGAYTMVNNSFGSFNTFKHTVGFGTGMLKNRTVFEGRLSQITSDGYIDRASSSLQSYYLSGKYFAARTSLQAVVFGGREVTYQSWYGTPESRVNNDEEAMLIHAANNGLSETQTANLLNSGRTYNFYEYENQVDDYSQDHYQLHLNHSFSYRANFSAALHYTYGRGFYEQYRKDDLFSDYGLNPIFLNATQQFSGQTDSEGNPVNSNFESQYSWDEVEFSHSVVVDANGDPVSNPQGEFLINSIAQISSTDLVRRRWLQNDFYGAVYNLEYKLDKITFDLGGAYSIYDGDHYGELTWMEHSNGTEIGDLYYLNNGFKTDWNSYLKTNYQINNNLNVYVDVQYRQVQYAIDGVDSDRRTVMTGDTLQFVNPKGGISWRISTEDRLYASVGVGQREPTRSDYIDAANDQLPRPEKMTDFELGYKRTFSGKYVFGINTYLMDYTDQLVLTGALNDVGNPIRTNVAESYRAGAEIELGWALTKNLGVNLNATFSQNRIKEFDEVVYDYTEDFDVVVNEFLDSHISFSPETIVAGQLNYKIYQKPNKHELTLNLYSKYVGEQYLDNTTNDSRKLDDYLVSDAGLTFTLYSAKLRELNFILMANNILDQRYSSNGYTYSYIYGEPITENFLYPQAGRHFQCSLNLSF